MNRIIAEYGGWKFEKGKRRRDDVWWVPGTSWRQTEPPPFHQYWPFLMAVVDIIEKTPCAPQGPPDGEYIVTIERDYCAVSAGGEHVVVDVEGGNTPEEDKIWAVHQCVYKFINYLKDYKLESDDDA